MSVTIQQIRSRPEGEVLSPMSLEEPIFIVGVSRSGTTLLAAILGTHSRLYCGPETFFFERLARADVRDLIGDSQWPGRAVSFLASISLGGSAKRVHELFGLSVGELTADLAGREPSVPAMLNALAGARARADGKARWAEKTPNHLLHLELIRRYYPTAPIVRIVRDPRDVALSLTKVPFGSTSKLANLYLWMKRDEQSWRFFEKDACSRTVRYEDLLTAPRPTLESLCAWLGERFEPGMLDPNPDAARMMDTDEWWKQQILKPLDSSRVALWRSRYTEGEARVADVLCRDALRRYCYPHHTTQVQHCFVNPLTIPFIEHNEKVLIEAAEHNIALRPLHWEVASGLETPARALVFWGQRGQMIRKLGDSTPTRLLSVLRLAALLTSRRVAGTPAYQVSQDSGLQHSAGFLEQVCVALVRLLSRRTTSQRLFGSFKDQGSTLPPSIEPVGPMERPAPGVMLPAHASRREGPGALRAPIFILGSHKSGSSLLRSLLDGHPELFVVPAETHFFQRAGYWVDYRLRRSWPRAMDRDGVIAALVKGIASKNSGDGRVFGDSDLTGRIDVDVFRASLESGCFEDSRSAFASYMQGLHLALMGQTLPDTRRVVEKSVENAEYAGALRAMFPDCRFVHIVRNPYASVVAIRKSKTLHAYPDLSNIVLSLQNSYYNLHRNEHALDNYLVITYESLVADVKSTMTQVASFLSIAPAESLSRPTVLGDEWAGNSSTGTTFQGVTAARVHQPLDITHLEIRLINAGLGPVLERFGYDRLSPKRHWLVPVRGERLVTYARNRSLFWFV